ncbi:hypothetical protein AB6846_03015 [Serratia proteamaculans]
MGDLETNAHVKPDWDHLRFGLFLVEFAGAVRQPMRQASAWPTPVCAMNSCYVVAAPALPLTTTLANHDNRSGPGVAGYRFRAGGWGTIRWIIEQGLKL